MKLRVIDIWFEADWVVEIQKREKRKKKEGGSKNWLKEEEGGIWAGSRAKCLGK